MQIDARTLEVTGDAAGNQIIVYPQQSDVVVDIGDDGIAESTAHRAAFDKIEVRGGGGDDRLIVQYADSFELPITLDGGSGNDDPGDDAADGNLGQDTIRLGSGNDGSLEIRPTAATPRNIASITLDPAGFEHARVRAVGGADNVNVGNLAGTGLRSADVDLRGSTAAPTPRPTP